MYSSDSEEAARDACIDVCPRDGDRAPDVTPENAASPADENACPTSCADVAECADACESGQTISMFCAEESRFFDDVGCADAASGNGADSGSIDCVTAELETPVIDSPPMESPAVDATPVSDAPESTPVACEVSEAAEVAEGIETGCGNECNGCECRSENATPADVCASSDNADNANEVRDSNDANEWNGASYRSADACGESGSDTCGNASANCPPADSASRSGRRNQIDVDESRFEMEEPKRPLMAVIAEGPSLTARTTARPGLKRMVPVKRSKSDTRSAPPASRMEQPAPLMAAASYDDEDQDFDLGLGPSPAGPVNVQPTAPEYASRPGPREKVLRGWRGLMNVFNKANQRAPKSRD
jgi:hypothetical protein